MPWEKWLEFKVSVQGSLRTLRKKEYKLDARRYVLTAILLVGDI